MNGGTAAASTQAHARLIQKRSERHTRCGGGTTGTKDLFIGTSAGRRHRQARTGARCDPIDFDRDALITRGNHGCLHCCCLRFGKSSSNVRTSWPLAGTRSCAALPAISAPAWSCNVTWTVAAGPLDVIASSGVTPAARSRITGDTNDAAWVAGATSTIEAAVTLRTTPPIDPCFSSTWATPVWTGPPVVVVRTSVANGARSNGAVAAAVCLLMATDQGRPC